MISITIRSTMKTAQRRPSRVIWRSSPDSAPGPCRRCIEQVHDGGEDHDEQHGLQAPDQGLEAAPWRRMMHSASSASHRRRRSPTTWRRTGPRYTATTSQELRAGVQPVDEGIAGEILAQGDVLQHDAPPPFCRRQERRAPARLHGIDRGVDRAGPCAAQRHGNLASPGARPGPSASSSSARGEHLAGACRP